jgi:excisionase family DNA binding protein
MEVQMVTSEREERLLLKVNEAATLLGLGRSTIYLLHQANSIPAVKIGRATRIPADGLRRWVERQTAEAEANLTGVA